MNKLSCAVMGDLLPLYAEDTLCQESQLLVQQHLKGCPYCQNRLKRMKAVIPLVQPDNQPFRTISRRILDVCKLAGGIFLLVLNVLMMLVLRGLNTLVPDELEGMFFLSVFLFLVTAGFLLLSLCVLVFRLLLCKRERRMTRWLSWALLLAAVMTFCAGTSIVGYLCAVIGRF